MLKRLATCSRAVVVHNPGAATLVRQHAPQAEVVTIPHLFAPPPPVDPAEVEGFRRDLNIPPESYVFGVFGFLRESKRLLPVLQAFRQLWEADPRVVLLVAGDFVSADLERACGPLLAHPGVRRLPYLSERRFWVAACAIDACINLRVPPAGETSGIAVRMMGIGKPVLLTESPENCAFPAGTYLPVPPGVAESSVLFDYMGILALSRAIGGEIGRMASDHIGLNHSVERISGMYWNLLCTNVASSS
jgi:glycosyltransferase involved in cell wall biosynthesis